ncbi:MAG: glycosyltransferase family 4 protein [Candidatus Binatus sp.]|jgi:glycosyltransferase involved in cell wall biosynthesis|uniref:glycosyltransferase family 4 protein n=1 Tax=Candidatus Binatus sp. TaxID=2811406 RepID=UPI003D148DA7
MAGAKKQSAFSPAPPEPARDFWRRSIPVSQTRVLFLNRSFWPDREATGQFLTELCDDLSRDHEVTIVAGPSRERGSAGFHLWSHEQRGRVSIVRTWGTGFSKSNLLGRLVNLGTYYLLAAVVALRLPRPDVIVAETDPPLLGALAAVLKRRWGCRLIYNVRDLYPDIAEATGGVRNPLLLGLLRRANDYAYKRSDLIVTLGHDMAARIVNKGVPADKVVVVPDWVDCGRIRPLESNPFRRNFGKKFVVMYSGNIGLSQQLEAVLEAADRLRDDERILFAMIGEGARKKWLEERARSMGLPNVIFLPYQPLENLAESLTAADLHLIPLAPGAAGCLVPSKIYGILAAGRPFIAMMEASAEVAQIARENAVGFVVRPGDIDGLVGAIREAVDAPERLKQMGVRARRLAELRFDRIKVTGRFGSVLAGVAMNN